MYRGIVTSLVGGIQVQLQGLPGFAVTCDAVVLSPPLAIGTRVIVGDLGEGDYVVVGRLP